MFGASCTSPPSSPSSLSLFLSAEFNPSCHCSKGTPVTYKPPMTSQDTGVPLPKFGEWDENNPASAEGFTVIFSKARDEKKNNGNTSKVKKNGSVRQESYQHPAKKKRCCCF